MFLRLGVISCVTLLTAISCGCSATPSFDCSKSTDQIETAICQNQKLGELDREMSANFKSAMNAPGADHQALLAQQREWLNDLRHCLADSEGQPTTTNNIVGCLSINYSRRIADLHKLERDPDLVRPDQAPCTDFENAIKAQPLKGPTWNASELADLIEAINKSQGKFTLLSGKDIDFKYLTDTLAQEGLKNESQRYPEQHAPIADRYSSIDIYQIPLTAHHLPDLVIGIHGGTDICSWYEMFFRGAGGKLFPGEFEGDMCVAEGENDVFVQYGKKIYQLSVSGQMPKTTFSFISFAHSGVSGPVCKLQPFLPKKPND